MRTVLLDLAPVPLDTPPDQVDAIWDAYQRYEETFLADPDMVDSRRVDRLRNIWQRARGRVLRAARVARTAIGALVPEAIAFLREMGRMAADLHLDEASHAKR